MLIQLESKLTADIDEIKKEIIDISYIGERLQDLRVDQVKTIDNLNGIAETQRGIERDIIAINNMFVNQTGATPKGELT
jgi:hypothetical protein